MLRTSICIRLFKSRIKYNTRTAQNQLHATHCIFSTENVKKHVVKIAESLTSELSYSNSIKRLKLKNQAAVLVPLCTVNGELCLLFTVRSNNLPTHKGQISFPGGGVKHGDTGAVDAALRETEEEIGFPRNKVDVWTTLPHISNHTRTAAVIPVVGYLGEVNIEDMVPDRNEVTEIFTVSLTNLVNNASYTRFRIKAKKRSEHDYVMPVYFTQYRIWGLTANIVDTVLSILKSDSYNQLAEGKFTVKVKLSSDVKIGL
nr:nucleoside diphosphate-linked moiety X motif 8-like [Ciona intestinalis]|eukprot:XP_002126646.1 nucleoside diphosphate-linked moiety X motif 8-like [Ciona intestinalis]